MNGSERRRAIPERRKAMRTNVHWPVLLFRGDETIESTTKDLSSVGFYCLSAERFAIGESLLCELKVPLRDSGTEKPSATIECRIRVVRVEEVGDGNFGIGCQIEEYGFSAVKAIVSTHSSKTVDP
jgi:PilZ domain